VIPDINGANSRVERGICHIQLYVTLAATAILAIPSWRFCKVIDWSNLLTL